MTIVPTKKILRFFPLAFRRVRPDHETDLTGHAAFPEGFHGTNPSFVRFGDGYLVCLRGVNYLLSGLDMSHPVFTAGDHYMTVNRFFLVDRAFRFQRALTGLDSAFDDVEDIKLFELGGTLMGSGSAANLAGPDGNRAIVLLRIDPAAQTGTYSFVASPFGFTQEKNWAPFVRQDRLHFVYSFDPLIVLRCDPADGSVSFLDPAARSAGKDLRFLVGGSSAGVPVPDGFLFAAHRRRVSVRMHRSYVSRIYHLDAAAARLTAGRYFSVGAPRVQFVNGLAREDGHLVLSYGDMDRSGHVCRVPEAALLPASVAGGRA